MKQKILFVSATVPEAKVLEAVPGILLSEGVFKFRNLEITSLVTGLGAAATAWSLMDWIGKNGKPDLAINSGIAGSYSENIHVGDVVLPYSDCFADAGIEDDDEYLTLYEAKLADPDDFPFRGGVLFSTGEYTRRLGSIVTPVKAITVNRATGSEATLKNLRSKFNPDIETMEGATFFYICCRENIPFLALRSVSNKVEKRNRSSWNIPLALNSLTVKLNEVLLIL